jgi:RimJ/RimL family protein N-acetyltransferase
MSTVVRSLKNRKHPDIATVLRSPRVRRRALGDLSDNRSDNAQLSSTVGSFGWSARRVGGGFHELDTGDRRGSAAFLIGMSVELPVVVESDRLSLEVLASSDAADVCAGRRHADWHPEYPCPDDCDAASMVVSDGPDASWGPRQIRGRADGLVLGTIGFMGPPVVVAGRSEVNVGYGLVAAARGSGLATEALRALLLEVDRLDVRVRARVAAENAASIRVLEKCGFVLVGSAVTDVPGDREYLRSRDRWRRR